MLLLLMYHSLPTNFGYCWFCHCLTLERNARPTKNQGRNNLLFFQSLKVYVMQDVKIYQTIFDPY